MRALTARITEPTTMTLRTDNYFAETYGLTPTHSEVVEALPQLTPGKALDLGCGSGRNTLVPESTWF